MEPSKNLYYEDDEVEFDRALEALRDRGVDLGDLDHDKEKDEDEALARLIFDPRFPRKYEDVLYLDVRDVGFDIIGGVNDL